MESVYLVYKTDSWHYMSSRVLMQVCTSKYKAIEVIKAYCKRYKLPFTQDDLTNLQWYDQTQCSKRSIEFEIEPQALSYIGIIIRTFEPLHFMNLSDQDREATLKARQALEAIVKANGYTVSYRTENTIKKVP